MDLQRIAVLGLWMWLLVSAVSIASGNPLFRVEHKFKGRQTSLRDLVAHDFRRHGRMLAGVDLSLGGIGNPSDTGLYFTKIRLGNPSKDYFVQVDTGSDILWVNCAGCNQCPTESNLGIELTLFDPNSSSTAKPVTCDDNICDMIYSAPLSGCKPDLLCPYEVNYGDGSSTSGFFVEDDIHYDKVSGNLQTTLGNGSIVFGCGSKQGGQLSSSGEAVDGIIGFGQANSSVLSQLAAAKKVKKVFSHCLDGMNGGGIFAIGEVVHPKLKTTPLIPNKPHYNVVVKAMDVDGDAIDLSTDHEAAILDSGTTLAYVPDAVYQPLIAAITSRQPGLKLHTLQDQFKCLTYDGNIDDGFPPVKIHFEESLVFTVHPHEYLFKIREDVWCIGWLNSGAQAKDGRDVFLLGDLVLANKLVMYDLENQEIGWTDYNCSSSIKIKDDQSGAIYSVAAHDLSAAPLLVSYIQSLTFPFVLITVMIINFL